MTKRYPIRVLHVVGGMNRGGAEAMIMNAFRHIDRERFIFDFAVNTEESCAHDEEIRSLGGRIFPHPRPGSVGVRRWVRAFEDTVRREGPFDAIHSHVHHFSGYTLRAASHLGIPIRIAHSHNTQDGQRSSGIRSVYRWWSRRMLCANATHLLACSHAAGEVLFGPDMHRPRRFQVLPNAIDLTPYATIPDDSQGRSALRERLGLAAAGLLIGHIGRFDVQKNHVFLIDILAEVVAAEPDAQAILVGDGPLRPDIQTKAAALGLEKRVHFLGVRSDVPRLMGALDVFLLPSLHEGLPVVLVEAQAAGVPCLISDNITTEVDMGMGLTERLSLQAKPHVWAERLLALAATPRPPWTVREESLQRNGYDVRATVSHLEAIYHAE